MKNDQRRAQLAGDLFYLTGRPCKRGHVAPRRAHNGYCTECQRLAGKQRWNKREVFLIDLTPRAAT